MYNDFILYNEGLDSNRLVDWEVEDNIRFGYFTTTDDKKYLLEIGCENFDIGIYYYKFYHFDEIMNEYTPEQPTETTQRAVTLQVMSTVEYELSNFVKTEQPLCIFFAAVDKSIARKNLYDLYCRKITSEVTSYKKKAIQFNDYTLFIIYKKNSDRAVITSIISEHIKRKYNIEIILDVNTL